MLIGGKPKHNPMEDSKEDPYLGGGMDADMHN